MISLHHVVADRNADLIRRFREDRLPPLCALMALDATPSKPALGGGTIPPLPESRGPMIWEKGTPHETSLWVPKSYGSYRNAFFAFVGHLCGPGVDMARSGACDVGHLFNRERAPVGAMIRVEAVLASVNRSHGAGYEKTSGASPVAPRRKADMRPFTKIEFVSVLEIPGVPSPASADDRPRTGRIRQESSRLGFPADIIGRSLAEMLEFAHRR